MALKRFNSSSSDSSTKDLFDENNWFEEATTARKDRPTQVVKPAYSVSSAVSLDYSNCGNGLFIATFIDNGTCGIIKLNPGGTKKSGRSKNSTLKFFVLQGKVDVFCNDKVLKLETFCYMEILNGAKYSMQNSGETAVYVLFNRFTLKPKVEAK